MNKVKVMHNCQIKNTRCILRMHSQKINLFPTQMCIVCSEKRCLKKKGVNKPRNEGVRKVRWRTEEGKKRAGPWALCLHPSRCFLGRGREGRKKIGSSNKSSPRWRRRGRRGSLWMVPPPLRPPEDQVYMYATV